MLKIALIAERQEEIKSFKRLLENRGYDVVFSAASRKEGLKIVEPSERAGVGLAIISENLGTGPEDGDIVTRAFQEAGIKVIGLIDSGQFFGNISLNRPVTIDELYKGIKSIAS